MAITVLQRPIYLSPAYNDLPVVVQSTNTASANFQYMGVLKNAAGDTLSTLKTKIYFDSADKGVFNLARILENYVSYDVPWGSEGPGVLTEQNSIFNYEFEIGEEGGTPPVETPNVTSITGWVFNGSLERRDFSTYASGDFLMQYPTQGKMFLTDQVKDIRLQQNDWLMYLYDPVSSHNPSYAKYLSYSSAGVLLKTVHLDVAVLTTNEYYIAKIPIGRNTEDSGDFNISSGSLPLIDPSASYFTVQLFETGNTSMSELKTVTQNSECTQYETLTLHYLNRYGGFDSFAFDLVHKQKFKTERKQFKRSLYNLANDVYSYDNDRHAVNAYDVREQKTLTLNSNWLNDTQAGEMRDLISSPVVFLNYGGTDLYLPVNIVTEEWEEKMQINEPLFNCELEISLADNYRRQSE